MPDTVITDNRSGPRYIAAFPIRAEWDTPEGAHVISEGETENVGPEGTLVHLQRDLPPVGSTVNLLVLGDEGEAPALTGKWTTTDPPINFAHIAFGEINRHGEAVGYHHRSNGVDPPSARVLRIVDE